MSSFLRSVPIDEVPGGSRAAPTLDRDLLARECHRAHEELLDLLANAFRQIASLFERAQRLMPARRRDNAVVYFGSAPAFALRDLHHPQDSAGQHDPGVARLMVQHHRVDRIAVLAERAGNEPPVERIRHAERQFPGNREKSQLRIEIQLERGSSRRFDDDAQRAVIVISVELGEIARLRQKVSEIERARLKRPENLDAYDLYLRAIPYSATRKLADAKTAAELLPELPQPGEVVHALMLGTFDLCQVISATVKVPYERA